jgi:ribosomal RNA-processing protein 7
MPPSQINSYTILPLTIPPTPAYPKRVTHTLYLQRHTPKIPTETDARSLFLVNVPIDSTSAHLRAVFTSLIGVGRFESVSFEHERNSATTGNELAVVNKKSASGSKKRKRGSEAIEEVQEDLPQIWDRELRRSGSTAVVVLVDSKSVESTLKAIKKIHKSKNTKEWPVWGEGVEDKLPKLGSARYLSHQKMQFPESKVLQINVDAFMTAFNQREEEKARMEKRARNVPDEDGFVTVTRGGRTGPARKEDAELKRVEMEERERKKRDNMGDFYRFQMRERRKAEMGELVKRFEEDKRKVETMRGRRGAFRPER